MESFKVGKRKHYPYQKAWEELLQVPTVVWALHFPLELFAGSHHKGGVMACAPEKTE
jgi:hypothetical protein